MSSSQRNISRRAEPTEQSQLRVELVRTPFLTPGLLFFLGLLAILAAEPIVAVAGQAAAGRSLNEVAPELIWVITGAAFVLSILVRRALVRRHPVPPLRFFDDHMELPPHVEAVASRSVPYTDVLSVGVQGRPGRLELLLETRSYVFAFGFGSFRDPNGAQRVVEELNRRITALPEARAIFEQADRRRALAEQALAVRPIATQAVLGVIVVLYANLLLLGSLRSPLGLLGWGANNSTLVGHGEYFRLFTATFLHEDVYRTHLHVIIDALALYFLGYLVERLLGWARFLIIFLGSGLAAAFVSQLLMPGEQSVGASGAIFGLLGALALINWRFRTELPLGFRQPLRWWMLILVLSLLIPLLPLLGTLGPVPFPRIDVAGHVTGLVVGLLLAAGLVHATHARDLVRGVRPLESAAAMALVALYVLALGYGVLYARDFDASARMRVAQTLLADPQTKPELVNQVSWAVATEPDAPEKALHAAEPAMRETVDQLPYVDAFRDTLATVHYRLGKVDRAIDEERQALAAVPRPDYASQLARFLATRLAHDGPISQGGATAAAVQVRLDPGPPAEPRALVIDPGDAPHPALRIFALVMHHDERLGLVQIDIAAGSQPSRRIALSEQQLELLGGHGVTLQLALIDGQPPSDTKPVTPTPRVLAWRDVPSIDALP